MSKFRSKIVEIEAVQWSGKGLSPPIPHWIVDCLVRGKGRPGSISRNGERLEIFTLEGTMTALPGDWIIRGTEGELYPCKPSVFDRKYELVEDL